MIVYSRQRASMADVRVPRRRSVGSASARNLPNPSALADVHAGPVHDLHVFREDPSDRAGREGPGLASDADDRFRAGLGGGGEEAGADGKGESQQAYDQPAVLCSSHHSQAASVQAVPRLRADAAASRYSPWR